MSWKNDIVNTQLMENRRFTGIICDDGTKIYEGDLINSFQNDYMPTEVY